MRVLILGSTGLLGQALVREANLRGFEYLGVARDTEYVQVDVTNSEAIWRVVRRYKPDVVVNATGLVSLLLAEMDKDLAFQVNTKPASVLAGLSLEYGFYYVQISTDHYYLGDKNRKHTEDELVTIVNEYARSKHAAELEALSVPNSLVLRTNIVGFRHKPSQPTFVEKILEDLENKNPMTIFHDYYTSSIDVRACARALFALVDLRPTGLLNLASSEVASKEEFVKALALKCGLDFDHIQSGSVHDMPSKVKRAESLGLDVSKAETLLGYALPGLDEVITSLADEYDSLKGKQVEVQQRI